ncbi:MAG TPA: hypothetical protein GX708_05100 [Gallicola sp.]|nr:hypothetical protein [Gallicola sp.]
MDKLEKLLDFVTQEEDKYYELSFNEMEKGNYAGHLAMTCAASSYQKIRYAIEDLMNEN